MYVCMYVCIYIYMGLQKLGVPLFGGPNNKDSSMLESI